VKVLLPRVPRARVTVQHEVVGSIGPGLVALVGVVVEQFAAALTALGVGVATGRFRAHMVVSLENDGPATLLLQSKQ